MSFVIMNSRTERLHCQNCGPKRYSEEGRAKAVCTKLNRKYSVGTFVVMSEEEFTEKHDPLVAVYNRISGDGKTPIYIRRSEVGTCVDPSTELYHCM